MSHKLAKQRRAEGRDRKTLTHQRQLRELVVPKSSFAVVPAHRVVQYLAVREQLDDYLLGDDGLLKILPAAAYERFDPDFRALWCKEMGYHLLPTVELVDWLGSEIGDASAIEICAGAGVLGQALGVPSIDWDVCGRFPAAKACYLRAAEANPIIGPRCERIEAMEAIAKYRPQVVFGGYVTQRLYPGEPDWMAGSAFGVEERTLIKCVRKYIVLSTRTTQQDKRIFRQRTRELSPPWLVTRHPDPAAALISVWENPAPMTVEDALQQCQARTAPALPVATGQPVPLTNQTTGLTTTLARMQR